VCVCVCVKTDISASCRIIWIRGNMIYIRWKVQDHVGGEELE
jgi:hypothetical protein